MCMLYLDLKISKDSSSSLSTVCLTTAIWNVNHIKKSHYSGKVVEPVLGALLRGCLSRSKSSERWRLWQVQWCKGQKYESFMYFFGVLKHLLNDNLFVRSLREHHCLLHLLSSFVHFFSPWITFVILAGYLFLFTSLSSSMCLILAPILYHSFSMGHGPLCGKKNWYRF